MWHNHPFSQRNKEQKTGEGGGGWRRRCQTKFEKVGYEI